MPPTGLRSPLTRRLSERLLTTSTRRNMRTAIFVYEPTIINILTSESDLELCSMETETVSLAAGENARPIARGIYKIDSSQDVQVTGDASVFDVVVANSKENPPTPPPKRATESFAALHLSAFHTFFAVPDAKKLENP